MNGGTTPPGKTHRPLRTRCEPVTRDYWSDTGSPAVRHHDQRALERWVLSSVCDLPGSQESLTQPLLTF